MAYLSAGDVSMTPHSVAYTDVSISWGKVNRHNPPWQCSSLAYRRRGLMQPWLQQAAA